MFDVMSQAKNAIEAYNDALKISSSNIANMSVTGYKKLDVSFQSIFERVLSGGTAASNELGGTNPQQFGQGMALSGVNIDFTAGDTSSGASADLAITGNGLFIVSPDGGRSYLYTRAGNFQVDNNGNLLSNNMQVYGLNNSGALVPISGLPSGTSRTNLQWLADGSLQYSADPSDTTPTWINTGFRIALTNFANSSGLAQAQGSSFAATLASGAATEPQAPGGTAGSLNIGNLEQSNVNYLAETINSIELQRAMSANLNMVKSASDMISNFITKLG